MKDYQRNTIYSVVLDINRKTFLPDIQRSFVWEKDQIYRLFDSLMRGYPISTFLFWKLTREQIEKIEKENDFRIKMYRFVDANDKINEEEVSRQRDEYYLVLDGQQRLTSLNIGLQGTWVDGKKRKKFQELYFDVLSGENETEDGILYDFQFMEKDFGLLKIEKLEDNQLKAWVNVKRIYEISVKKGLSESIRSFVDKILDNDKEKLLSKCSTTISDRVLDLYNTLRTNQVIYFYPEDEEDYDRVLDIFVRTNAGGTKLTYSDLLFSKFKLKWDKAREEMNLILEQINRRNFDFDSDFILKTCLVLYAKDSQQMRFNANNLSDDKIKLMKNEWENISKALLITRTLMESFWITDKKLLPSYNALIPVVYWIYKKGKLKGLNMDNEKDAQSLTEIRVWLIKALLSGVFGGQSDSVLNKCKDATDHSKDEVFPAEEIQKKIEELKNKRMEVSTENIDNWEYHSKESYLFLSICYKGAINYQPTFKGNFPEQDHIFCRDELEKANIPDSKINSIYNIRYVSMIDNRQKSNIPYRQWAEQLKTNKELVFQTHLIPKGEWSVENFNEFLEARKKLMMANFNY